MMELKIRGMYGMGKEQAGMGWREMGTSRNGIKSILTGMGWKGDKQR